MEFKDLLLDGGMGSLLLERSGVFAPSESFNESMPDLVKAVHLDYLKAGSDILYANTFGANPYKTDDYVKLIKKGLSIARSAVLESSKKAFVALDVGPSGKIIGKGGITFEEAYDAFAMVIKAGEGADLIVLETFTDLAEMRAAILAAKENSTLPVLASMSFEKNGRTAFGCSVEAFAVTASSLKVDAIGLNCSVGPVEMLRYFNLLKSNVTIPAFVKPNAGMPEIICGKTVYGLGKEEFAKAAVLLKKAGADMIGGCCGTTPEYLSCAAKAVENLSSPDADNVYRGKLCSYSNVVNPENALVIGERINPTGKKVLQKAVREGDVDYIVSLGPKQEEEGAEMLDVNLGVSGEDDGKYMGEVIEGLQRVSGLPLSVDTGRPATLEKALRLYSGRALVNSVTGEEKSLRTILPIVAKYGAAVVGLTLDEKGIPETAEGRVEVAKKILSAAKEYGIAPKDVYIDCLTMSEGAIKGSAKVTLDALKEVKKLGCRTVLGVSNVSFGLPAREDLNAAFLSLCRENGLDACIYNPKFRALSPTREAIDFLTGKIPFDEYASFVTSHTQKEEVEVEDNVISAVKRGDTLSVKKLVSSNPDAAKELFAALDIIGDLYEKGKLFLPQLISAADAAKAGLDILFAKTGEVRESKGTLILATVKGDVHDIGKNIVKAVVSNYGYTVVDLGKDVGVDAILDKMKECYPCVLGLSALMTTTANNMADIAKRVREVYPDVKILTGGAVITPSFSKSIGGIYCKDAAAAVKALNDIYKAK